jgi:hypothetical protein
MPIPANKDALSSNEFDENLPEQQEADTDESTASDANLSEVARRINLLGKLIIPPAAP